MEGKRDHEANRQPGFRAMLERHLPPEPRHRGEQSPSAIYSSDEIFHYIRPDEAQRCIEALGSQSESAAALRSYLMHTEQQLAAVRDYPELYGLIKSDADQAVAQFLRITAPMATAASQARQRANGWGSLLNRLRDR